MQRSQKTGPFWSREKMCNGSRANRGNEGYEAQLKDNSGQYSKMYILGDGNCLNRNLKQNDGNHEKELEMLEEKNT